MQCPSLANELLWHDTFRTNPQSFFTRHECCWSVDPGELTSIPLQLLTCCFCGLYCGIHSTHLRSYNCSSGYVSIPDSGKISRNTFLKWLCPLGPIMVLLSVVMVSETVYSLCIPASTTWCDMSLSPVCVCWRDFYWSNNNKGIWSSKYFDRTNGETAG